MDREQFVDLLTIAATIGYGTESAPTRGDLTRAVEIQMRKHIDAAFPRPSDDYDDRPAIVISRGQLSEFAGRTLTDNEVERIADAWPNSSIPEALGTIAGSFAPEED